MGKNKVLRAWEPFAEDLVKRVCPNVLQHDFAPAGQRRYKDKGFLAGLRIKDHIKFFDFNTKLFKSLIVLSIV